ncbi:MAG: RAD55 family ATPase [Candidatus Thorarchaeota archaeon]
MLKEAEEVEAARSESKEEQKPARARPMIGDLVEFGQLTQISYMLVGPLGSGKTTYAEAFLAEGIAQGFPAVFVTTDVSPRVIRNDMSRHGWSIEEQEASGQFVFIDGYSERMGAPKSGTARSLMKVDDISELGIVLSEVLDQLVVARVVIDSLSTLILHSNEAAMPRAVQRLSGRVTQSSHSIMYILEEGVHEEKTYATFSYLADAVVRFRIDDSGPEPVHQIRMERMRGTDTSRVWHDFVIER